MFSRLRTYLQLFRLPAVFTAMADILLGFWFTHGVDNPGPAHLLMLLLTSSSLLYIAGMVLNDYYDVEQDARERPNRPIPSGRISPVIARAIGFEFLVLGTAFGWLTSAFTQDFRAGAIATALAIVVFLYDRVLKRTLAGPLAMGACRALNVLLGMSAAQASWQTIHYLVAGGLGLYIVGVTWFARREAAVSKRLSLSLAVVVMAAGIFTAASYYALLPAEGRGQPLQRWFLMVGLLAALILWRCLQAILQPVPERVQAAVRNCLLSLIVLDAVLLLGIRGPEPYGFLYGISIAVLLLPAVVLGRWLYAT